MERIQELYGFLISSVRRLNVLKALKNKPLRPFEIAKKIKYKAPNVSKTLFQLEKYNLVECITPNKGSWRVYSITDRGKEVLNFAKKFK